MFISNNQIIWSNIKRSQNIMTMIVEKHKSNDRNIITFIKAYNPNHQISPYEFKISITNTSNTELQKAFHNKVLLLTKCQPKTIRNMLAREKSEMNTIPKSPKLTGLILCNSWVYYKTGSIIHFTLFLFKLNNEKTLMHMLI